MVEEFLVFGKRVCLFGFLENLIGTKRGQCTIFPSWGLRRGPRSSRSRLSALSLFGPTKFSRNPNKQTLLPNTRNSSTIQVTFNSPFKSPSWILQSAPHLKVRNLEPYRNQFTAVTSADFEMWGRLQKSRGTFEGTIEGDLNGGRISCIW